jgi:ATP-dependent DNA ligase
MTELDILDAIKSAKGKNEKANLLKAAKHDARLAALLDAAYNYKRKFFIKSWNSGCTAMNSDDAHYDFIELLKFLESGKGRGDVAKNKVRAFFDMLNQQQKHWYERILKKDLKMGVSVKTAVKCGFDIPVFDVQLAKDGKKMNKLESFIKRGGYASRKFDGYRCLAVIVDGDAKLYSRNGTLYENFATIEVNLAAAFPTGKYVLDGEIMSDDFQAMQSTAFSSSKSVGDVVFHVFDQIDYDEWNTQVFTTKKKARYDNLVITIDNLPEETKAKLVLVEHTFVNDLQVLLQLEKDYMAAGYEGVMFIPDIIYYIGKKSNKMIKLKTFISQEVEIVGFNLGKPDGKYAKTLGSLRVKQEDGQICNCNVRGDKFRDDVWNNQDHFINKIFEAVYQEETADGIMRFGYFKRWREDK